MRLLVGDDGAEDHHDVEVMNEARERCWRSGGCPRAWPGWPGCTRWSGEHLGEDADDAEVVVGIETDRGPWVAALVAAGYTVLRGEPAAGVAVPGAARRVRGQERLRRRAHAQSVSSPLCELGQLLSFCYITLGSF